MLQIKGNTLDFTSVKKSSCLAEMGPIAPFGPNHIEFVKL
jgi:hypothetical protein